MKFAILWLDTEVMEVTHYADRTQFDAAVKHAHDANLSIQTFQRRERGRRIVWTPTQTTYAK